VTRKLHDAAAGGVGQGCKYVRNLLFIVNHGVKYNASGLCVKRIVNMVVKYLKGIEPEFDPGFLVSSDGGA
jgi:hypothetical protein